jgi:hypothetical protein
VYVLNANQISYVVTGFKEFFAVEWVNGSQWKRCKRSLFKYFNSFKEAIA